MSNELIQGLLEFIHLNPTPYHVTDSLVNTGLENGFSLLDEKNAWDLGGGSGYVVGRNDSSAVMFRCGKNPPWETGFRIAVTHGDSPGLRIKNSPEVVNDGYLRLNTEVYGGPLLSTWMDRPLGLAGRVILQNSGKTGSTVRILRIGTPLCIIPSLASHMNRDANKGTEINPQRDCLPLLSMTGPDNGRDALAILIAKELSVPRESIIDYDLFTWDISPGCLVGASSEFLSSSRIDNLGSVYAALRAICGCNSDHCTSVLACFNSEEVGSMTWHGADSRFLETVLERIVLSCGGGRSEYHRALARSFVLSADAAHGVHPAWPDKSDPTNRPVLNRGVVIKVDSNGRYSSDGASAAFIENLCRDAGIQVQRYYNRSDSRGGSTIGPITASQVSIRGADVGIPILAMHSSRELCGCSDPVCLYRLIFEFFR